MSEELKPCPFCGSDMHEECYSDMYEVACHKCKSSTGLYRTMAEAEAAWNRRAPPDSTHQAEIMAALNSIRAAMSAHR